MKKILFLQLDDAHFVIETKLFLNRYYHELSQFDLYLCSINNQYQIQGPWKELLLEELSEHEFEMTINLSLSEKSWEVARDIKTKNFVGTRLSENNSLQVVGNWSIYLLQLKGGAAFLPFHLQDIYKGIVGCKTLALSTEKKWKDEVIYWQCPNFINQDVFLILIAQLKERYKNWEFIQGKPQKDKPGFYVGPAGDEVSLWPDQNHRLMILKSHFEGLHFAPTGDHHWLVNPHTNNSDYTELYQLMIQFFEQLPCQKVSGWEVYQTRQENLFGTDITALSEIGDNYPFYQFHVVIWQYLLNLFDVNLEVSTLNSTQLTTMKFYEDVLLKITQFADIIVGHLSELIEHFDETNFDIKSFQSAVKQIQEFEEVTGKIAEGHPLLRPFLDYYQITRGQAELNGLRDQIQDQLLTLSEQSSVLKALVELISMTIQKSSSKIEKTSQGRDRHGNDREF